MTPTKLRRLQSLGLLRNLPGAKRRRRVAPPESPKPAPKKLTRIDPGGRIYFKLRTTATASSSPFYRLYSTSRLVGSG